MTRKIRGLASTWDLDLDGDVIMKGAYARTIADWRRSGRIIPLVDQHDYSSVLNVLGKLTSAKETDVGLECEFDLLENDSAATALLERVTGKFLNSFSIGYRVVDSDVPPEELQAHGVRRVIWELELLEVSVVIFPANPRALITSATAKAHELTFEERKLLGRLTALKIRQHVRIDPRDDRALSGRITRLLASTPATLRPKNLHQLQLERYLQSGEVLSRRIDRLKARHSA